MILSIPCSHYDWVGGPSKLWDATMGEHRIREVGMFSYFGGRAREE